MVLSKFFKAVKEQSAATTLTCLKEKAGNRVSSSVGLSNICSDFYQRLYNCEPSSSEQDRAIRDLTHMIPDDFNLDMKLILQKPIDETKIK
jgi:hypothetical protein